MSDFDPKSRELCPDGGCIGVIGPDGTCKECGRVSPNAVSDPRNRGLDLEAAEEEELPEELASRRLCPDGGCIGVVGEDGRCKACGRSPGEIDEAAVEDEDLEDDGEDAADRVDEEGSEASALPRAPRGWAERRLCPDGTCVGVLDPTGKCPICGGPAPTSNPSS